MRFLPWCENTLFRRPAVQEVREVVSRTPSMYLEQKTDLSWCVYCSNLDCHYSHTARLGKPKGSRNKKTLQKLGLLPAARGRRTGTGMGRDADLDAVLEEVTRDEQQESKQLDGQEHRNSGFSLTPPAAAAEPSMAMAWLTSSPPCPPVGHGWELPPQTDDDVFRGHLGIDMPFAPSLPDKDFFQVSSVTHSVYPLKVVRVAS